MFSLMFVYLMCGPRQLFFQCGPETPKGWTPQKAGHPWKPKQVEYKASHNLLSAGPADLMGVTTPAYTKSKASL